MTLLAALAALEQEWRTEAKANLEAMDRAKQRGDRASRDVSEIAATTAEDCADKLAALRVRFEGAEPGWCPGHCDCNHGPHYHINPFAPGPDPEPVKEPR